MLICSWNIFGIKAHRDALAKAFERLHPDVFCLVETKTGEPGSELQFEGYHRYWNQGKMANMNGVAVYTKQEPLKVIHDKEEDGRILALEFESFFIVCTYIPYSSDKNGLLYRLEWNRYYQDFVHELQESKPVICCGDFNIVRSEIDAWDGNIKIRKGCFYEEERSGFERLLAEEGLCDVYRELNPSNSGFTYWPYSVSDAREKNLGYRIDYFLVSKCLMEKVVECEIHKEIEGSCNCPQSIRFTINK